ncbi:MAG: S41 family peptidase [Planctomycetota bacterium]
MTAIRTTTRMTAEFAAAAAIFALTNVASAQVVSGDWFRHPAISPDGSTLVFVHAGDLYKVPVSGGRAVPLTLHDAYESHPVWSHDGSMIAFSSDRFGNDDVFVMPSQGGQATRLTYHSADDHPSDFRPDGSSVVFSSSRMDAPESALFPSGVLPELYDVSIEGGTPTMVLTTPAANARFTEDGRRITYEDIKGYEDALRKHHRSAIARDVWVYDSASGEHTKLTQFEGEDRNPVWAAGDGAVYFLSERDGDSNVYRMARRAGANATRLTSFEHHPVRHLSVADNGTLAFSWHGDLYTLREGGDPDRVDVTIAVDGRDGQPRTETRRSGASEFSVSPNGKELAFVLRGEVFVTSADFTTTRRVTHTPEQERSVSFRPDGRALVYAGERDGSWNIYESELADEGELYFFSATKVTETEIAATESDEFQPFYAPAGDRIAYLYERNQINVLDRDTGETHRALAGDLFYSYSDGDHWFDWSPDARWLTTAFYDRGRIFYSEAGLVPAVPDGHDEASADEPFDLSRSGYNDVTPMFAMNGGAIVWQTDRYGERAHGSWGAEYDVVAAFLTQDAFDRFRLSKEEYQLKKELDERAKDEEAADENDEEPDAESIENGTDADDEGANDEGAGDDTESEPESDELPEPIDIEFEGIDTRTVRLTTHASDLAGFALAPDGDKLYYLARFERGYDLWVRDFREESVSLLAKLNAGSASMVMSDDGDTIFLLTDGSLSSVKTDGGTRKTITFSAEMMVDESAERAHLLEHVWRQTNKKFYRTDMHGVDWPFYLEQYRPKLEGIANNQDFATLLSELLGELNASHTGGRYRSGGSPGDASTASLGVIWESGGTANGARIAEVLENGPLDRATIDIEPGDTVIAVDGIDVAGSVNFFSLLEGKAGDRVRLTVRSDDEQEGRDVVVRPVSRRAESQLLYERWVRTREAIVDELSGGRLGYAHVRGMNDASFREFYERVMGEHYDKEALIVDTRFNGGGWLHDDLATFLSGNTYVNLYPRNDLAPGIRYHGDPSRRWTKPSVVVMSESNYSDAHFFPWVYTELGLGDTVGMPVPGTTTAVWWESLFTGDLVFGIPQVGAKGLDGVYLENNQLEPTHLVPMPPDAAANGRDTQLEAAVRVLLGETP